MYEVHFPKWHLLTPNWFQIIENTKVNYMTVNSVIIHNENEEKYQRDNEWIFN